MAKEGYPDRESEVTVTFVDGEVKKYRISAGASITRYLADQVANTGVLVLLNGGTTHNIPIAQIREYEIQELQ